MQQNLIQLEDRAPALSQEDTGAVLQSAESYLSMLKQHFSKDLKTSQIVHESQEILRKIRSLLEEIIKNNYQLGELRAAFLHRLQGIKMRLSENDENQFIELTNMLQKLEDFLLEHPLLTMNDKAFDRERSTGTQYLHSLGFDRIIRMINAASIHEPEWMSRTGNLLILDNNQNTSQALERRLTREGHRVFQAESEVQAFGYLRSQNVEAILIDYSTFKNELYDFLQKLKREPSINYLPIIVIEPPEDMSIVQKITEAGISDYLLKPINPALLKMRVHAALEKKYAFEQRMKRLHEMQRTRRELEAAIQNLPDGYAIFDQDNHLVIHNNKLFEFYPHLKNREEMIRGGLTFEKFLEANMAANIYEVKANEKDARQQWIEEKKANFLLPASQWEEVLKNRLILAITTYRTPDGGGALVAKDISKDKAHHLDLTFLAYHDFLTGLPNRKAFHQKLSQAILAIDEGENDILAVLFLDLDGFKYINDTYGHDMGDWLLNQVGQRLHRCVRGDDMVARFGGDEFCIILHRVSNRKRVEMVANRILKSISEPYIRNDISMSIGLSIGIGLYSLNTQDSEALLKEADAAMYTVKQSGKGRYQFYDDLSANGLLLKPHQAKAKENRQKDSTRPQEVS